MGFGEDNKRDRLPEEECSGGALRPSGHHGFIQARLLTLSVCSETSVFISVSTMVGGTHGFTTVSRGTSNLCTTRTSETRPGTHAGRPIGDIHPPERPRVVA